MILGTDSTTSPSATTASAPAIGRRQMLRRAAILAGATGAAVVALSPEQASADTGDNLVLGQVNTAGSETTLSVGGDVGGTEPALGLENVDGPSLRLNSLGITWAGQ